MGDTAFVNGVKTFYAIFRKFNAKDCDLYYEEVQIIDIANLHSFLL